MAQYSHQPQRVIPALRCKGFGEYVSHLLFGVYIEEVDILVVENLVSTSQVNLVGARNVPKLCATLLFNDLDRRLVVLKDFKADLPAEYAAP